MLLSTTQRRKGYKKYCNAPFPEKSRQNFSSIAIYKDIGIYRINRIAESRNIRSREKISEI